MASNFKSGTDFAVSSDVAVGKSAEAIATFKGLQADLNYFAEKAGFDVVKVDGKLGPKSVSALRAVFDAVVATNQMLRASLVAPESTTQIAETAAGVREWLDGTARTALSVGTLRRYHQGAGKDWNTKESIAYGAGPVHEDFKALQNDLNAFSSTVHFDKLDVDGFLGPKTAKAVTLVYNAVVAKSSAFDLTMFPVPDTKEEVAEYTQFIRAWLKDTATPKLLLEQPVS